MKEQEPFSDQELPAQLVHALGTADDQAIAIPRTVDAAVLEAFRLRLGAARRRRLRRRRIMAWSAVPAAAALALWFVAVSYYRAPVIDTRMDLDANGVIDVLDAFTLARQIHRGSPVSTKGDLNQDGSIDAADVEIVIAQAVYLSNRGHR